jgi:hypothetical protein
MSDVYEAVFTPDAELLCFPCHGPTVYGRPIHRYAEHCSPLEPAPAQTTRCCRCSRPVWTDREDVMSLCLLRDLVNGLLGTGRVELDQTGGMTAGLRLEIHAARFVSVAVSDESYSLYLCGDMVADPCGWDVDDPYTPGPWGPDGAAGVPLEQMAEYLALRAITG